MSHREEHPLEYQLWDVVVTVWIMGWVGWLPTFILDTWWSAPVCALFMLSPNMYVNWRASVHASQWLRCDWLGGS